MKRTFIPALLALIVIAAALAYRSSGPQPVLTAAKAARYVGTESCAGCHSAQHSDWHGSDHERAMAHATPDNVLGDFDNRKVTFFEQTSHMFERDNGYFVTTDNQLGEQQTFQVKYTFGWRPLQQYLVQFEDGRLQVLPFCWDTEKKRVVSHLP